MNPAIRICLALLLPGAAATAGAQEAVSLQRQDQKTIAVMAYAPKGGGCQGVAIISPGAGGSEKGYGYLGEAMAALGYQALVLGHPESGRQALRHHMPRPGSRDTMLGSGVREGLADLITDPEAYQGRFMDIAAARQWAQGRCRGRQTVLLGHSMGAATALMEAGARNQLGLSGSRAFDVYIALSPQGAGPIFPANAWADLQRPVLTVTGTRDDELGGASWQTRTEPYRNMPPGCKWLAVIDGATHMNFAGNGMARRTEARTSQVIDAFLDAVQQGDCKAPRPQRGMAIESK